jgi:hypothetical protein
VCCIQPSDENTNFFMLLEIESFSRNTTSILILGDGRVIFYGDKATIIWAKAILLSFVSI